MQNSIVLVFAVAALIEVHGQVANTSRPAFDVVSIKPNVSAAGMSGSSYRPGGVYLATNVSLRFMIQEAYSIEGYQLLGGPNWIDKDRFDVQGRTAAVEAAADPSDGMRRRLLLSVQSMLEDRFRLKLHRETKELPVYALVQAKPSLKLIPVKEPLEQCGFGGGPLCAGTSIQCCREGLMDFKAESISVARFAESLGPLVRRPVIDRTGLRGVYNIKLQWLREDVAPTEPDSSGPSIFTALQEQLGLKLESSRGPVEVFVIDDAQKPSEN